MSSRASWGARLRFTFAGCGAREFQLFVPKLVEYLAARCPGYVIQAHGGGKGNQEIESDNNG